MARTAILAVFTVSTVLSLGCSSSSGGGKDWWRWWEKDESAKESDPPADNTVDQDLINKAMSDDALDAPPTTSPTTTSGPTSEPVSRDQWAKPPKPKERPATRRKLPPKHAQGSIETPILFVNDETISVQEVLDPIRKQLEEATQTMSLPEYRRFLQDNIKREVVQLIDEVLAYGEAKKQITEEMEPAIAKAVDETVRNRINAEFQGRDARYEAYLQRHGRSRTDVRRRLRRQLVVKQYLNDMFLPLIRKPTRRDLLRYYQKNPEEFTQPLRVEMFLIDVPYWAFLEGTSKGDRQALWKTLRGPRRIEARRAAQRHMKQALEELRSGIPFDAVARSYSFGPNAGKGGAWGPVSPGALTGRFAKATEVLFELKPGETSDVIRTGEGLLVVRAGERFEQRSIPFVEAQPKIEEKLNEEEQLKRKTKLLIELRSKATIGDAESFISAVLKAAPKHPDAEKTRDFRLR